MKNSIQERSGFSLIEVVIAMGIATFALISIFGLFSTSLTTNKDASTQQEGFEVERVLPAWLAGTNSTNPNSIYYPGTLFTTLYPGKGSAGIYVYTATNQGIVSTVVTNTAPPTLASSFGMVYYVTLRASSNAPTNIFVNGVSAQASDWNSWPALPVTARVFQIPNPLNTNSVTNALPTMIFDFVIPR